MIVFNSFLKIYNIEIGERKRYNKKKRRGAEMKKAILRREKIRIPTYRVGEEEKLPMFFEKRVYQGSSGRVYPNPVTEKIYDEKTDCEYDAVILENDYIYLVVLPELGGRIYMPTIKVTVTILYTITALLSLRWLDF